MNVALVARGPTRGRLARHPRGAFDCVLAVNHAAAEFHADWWVFGDVETYDVIQPAGAPRWCISAETSRRLLHRGVAVDASIWETLPAAPNRHEHDWTVFSATAALVLARSLGAEQITCFGVVDEHPTPGEAQRWETERRIWNATASSLNLTIIRA